MNCHEFRSQHLDFTEHALTAAALAAAQGHLETCARCARFDLVVRRGLLVARNLPPVVDEADLYPRIAAQLAAERTPPVTTSGARRRTATALIAAATAAFAAGVILSPRSIRPAPSTSTRQAESALAPLASFDPPAALPPALRTDFNPAGSWGMPLWPRATPLDETPARFAGASIIATTASR
jgi:hypothetical protein